MIPTISMPTEMSHSEERISPRTRRCGGTVTRGWSLAPRSVSTLAAGVSPRLLKLVRSPWARVSR